MTYSQKYALVHFISPVSDGTIFDMSKWPLHATLVDVFAIDRERSDLNSKIASLIHEIHPVDTVAKNNTVLGTTPVVLLDKTPALLELHMSLVALLESNGAVFNTPEFNNEGFLPHCTIQKSGTLHEGDGVKIDSISLVDMFPDNDWKQRRVLSTFKIT